MGGTGRTRRAKRIAKHGTGIEGQFGNGTGLGRRARARKRRLQYEMNRKRKGEEQAVRQFEDGERNHKRIKRDRRRDEGERKTRKEDTLRKKVNKKVEELLEAEDFAESGEEEEAQPDKGEEDWEEVQEDGDERKKYKGNEAEGGESDEKGEELSEEEEEGTSEEESAIESDTEEEQDDGRKIRSSKDEPDDQILQKVTSKGFSDENASWLKLKGKRRDDLQDESGSSSDESSSEDELERGARLIREENERITVEASKETAEQAKRGEMPAPFRLETGDVAREAKSVSSAQILGETREDYKVKIQGVLTVLSNLKSYCEPGKSRSDYVSAFNELVCKCYGYNMELLELLSDVFPLGSLIDFVEASESPRPLTIRSNPLKTRRRQLAQTLISRGVNLDPLPFAPSGLLIFSSDVPIGATPEYLGGHYTIQSASSLLPVIALDPQPGEQIIDLAAAPGGKTTDIGARMQNQGLLVANDFKKPRMKSLVANIHRMGVRNSVVCNYDGRDIPRIFGPMFDRALIDAPCSGTGVINRDPSVKSSRDRKDVYARQKLQKELLLAAIDSVNPHSKNGGIIVYSTCSVLIAENEAVIDYALRKRDVKVLDTGFEIGVEGFTRMRQHTYHPSVKKGRRIYPHIHNLDGFFVCKLQKKSNIKNVKDIHRINEEKAEKKKIKKETEEARRAESKKSEEINGHVKGASSVKRRPSEKEGAKGRKSMVSEKVGRSTQREYQELEKSQSVDPQQVRVDSQLERKGTSPKSDSGGENELEILIRESAERRKRRSSFKKAEIRARLGMT